MRVRSIPLGAAIFAFGFSFSIPAQVVPQNFVSVPSCRIADTRTASGGVGPISGGTYRYFSATGKCGVPANASSVSLNVTAVPQGVLSFLTVLPALASLPFSPPTTSTLNDVLGTVIANSAIVTVGYLGQVMIYVTNSSDVVLDVDGYFVDQTASSSYTTSLGTGAGLGSGQANTAIGFNALSSASGSLNSAVGYGALSSDTTGFQNTAVGEQALSSNTTGSQNTAIGIDALTSNQVGGSNTALGVGALLHNLDGNANVAIGESALASNSSGTANTAVGYDALAQNLNTINMGYNTALGYGAGQNITTGSYNIVIGENAGTSIKDEQFNIEIGSQGQSGDSGVIRIGDNSFETSTYIAGIYGSPVTGSAVLVNSNGQLGVQSSSIRFKKQVRDMADASDALMTLRPVTFHYKQPDVDGNERLQFGLIAEEVANAFPELVVRDKDGRVDSVQYHELPVLLLNEFQKQHWLIKSQSEQISALEVRLAFLERIIAQQTHE